MAGQLGAKGLFTGLGARLVMIGTLTAGQFMIYGKLRCSSRLRVFSSRLLVAESVLIFAIVSLLIRRHQASLGSQGRCRVSFLMDVSTKASNSLSILFPFPESKRSPSKSRFGVDGL
jgi:hypothetical protein